MNGLFLLPALAVVYAGVAENPLDADKAAHLGAGYIVADVASEIKLPCPLCWSIAAGAVKEGLDSREGKWDWRDFGCTALGGGLQITVHW